MRLPLRRLAAALALCCLSGPALADTTVYQLTAAWQQVGTAGQSVLIASPTSAIVSTGSSTPGANAGFGVYQPTCLALTSNLYAIGGGLLTVTTGVSCAGASSSGGSSGISSPLGPSTAASSSVAMVFGAGATLPSGSNVIGAVNNEPALTASGTLTNSGDTVNLGVDGQNTLSVQTSSGWTGSAVFEATADNSTWTTVSMVPYAGGAPAAGPVSGSLYEMAVGGLVQVRVRATTAITGGPVTVTMRATNGLKSLRVGNPATNPLTTVSSNPAAPLTGQVKIATTGTAVCLPSAALVNGLIVKAKSTNASQSGSYSGMVGGTSVTTTYDGTGNGYPLAPGESMPFGTATANTICFNGTAGDIFSYGGN